LMQTLLITLMQPGLFLTWQQNKNCDYYFQQD